MDQLRHFIDEGFALTDLFGSTDSIAPQRYADYRRAQRELDFLRDVVSRAAVIGYCHDALCQLTDGLHELHRRVHALPAVPGSPNTRIIPPELSSEEHRRLIQVDAFTALIYYETTSLVAMVRQLSPQVHIGSELQYLIKVRDRFFSHSQWSGVARSPDRGWSLPSHGFLRRDAVALGVWSSSDPESDPHSKPGTASWSEQRQRNETLILSPKKSEQFSAEERRLLLAVGVRECDVVRALEELGALLASAALPELLRTTTVLVNEFGWGRYTDHA